MGAARIYFLFIVFFTHFSFAKSTTDCFSTNNFLPLRIELKVSSDAEQMASQLSRLGFRCTDPAPSYDRGYRCRGKISSYPEPVNFYIPPGYKKETAGPLAMHFHGHNINGRSDASVHFNIQNGNGDYGKMLANSGTNTLLIIPESLGNCETYADYFKAPRDLDKFMQEIESTTGRSISSLSFSSHSGGDRTMDRLAVWYQSNNRGEYLGRTKNIALFDSLYANSEALARWPQALKNEVPISKFLNSYVVGSGASTIKHMQWLRTKVPLTEAWKYREVRTQHMSIMRDGGFSDFLGYAEGK